MNIIKDGRKSASARVTVTLDIQVSDSWGEDCSVKQVHEQAVESAHGVLARLLQSDLAAMSRISIVGTPKVSAVIVTRER